METVSRHSEAFVQRQELLFRSMAEVPLGSYELVAAWERFGDLVRPEDERRYPLADDVSIPVTEERYTIAGYDRRAAVEDIYYTYVLQDEEWLIAEDTDLDDIALYSARHLWDFGAVTKQESGHFLVLSHPCDRAPGCLTETDFVALAEQGLERVDRYWPVRWPHDVIVLVPSSTDELERMIQSTFDLENFVAFAYSTVDQSEGIDYTGHRIIPNPDAFRGRAGSQVLKILAHELLHIATRDHAGPFVPVFLDEGYAELVGHDADESALAFFNAELASGVFNGLIPEDYEFLVGTGTDVYRSYQKAYSLVRFLYERYGLEAVVRFYRALGRLEIVPGTVRYHVGRAMRNVFGAGYEQVQRMWADSIRA